MAEREEDEQILPEVVDREGEEENSFLEEAEELTSIITRVVDGDGSAAAGVYDRYKAIVRWQKLGQLVICFADQGFLRTKHKLLALSPAAVQVPGAVPVAGCVPGTHCATPCGAA